MQDKQAHVDFKRAEMALQRAVNRLNVSDMNKNRKGFAFTVLWIILQKWYTYVDACISRECTTIYKGMNK